MTALRLFIHRFRRPLAAVSAAVAVLLVASLIRPAGPALTDVVVAQRSLPAGTQLTSEDLAVLQVPVEYVAPGAIADLVSAAGRTIASDMDAGETLTRSRLVATTSRADGRHTVPVRLADAEAAQLLLPGSTIDLVLLSDSGFDQRAPRVVAEGVQVVTVPRRPTTVGLGPASSTTGSLVVVATDRRTAFALAAVGAQPGLGVVLR
jgi:Flp pilus assembly protein CpaB